MRRRIINWLVLLFSSLGLSITLIAKPTMIVVRNATSFVGDKQSRAERERAGREERERAERAEKERGKDGGSSGPKDNPTPPPPPPRKEKLSEKPTGDT